MVHGTRPRDDDGSQVEDEAGAPIRISIEVARAARMLSASTGFRDAGCYLLRRVAHQCSYQHRCRHQGLPARGSS
jgi:hypothetical protein